MIQRIQTVHLIIAVFAAIILFIMPIGKLVNGAEEYLFLTDYLILPILTVALIILCLVTIFLYKNRKLQIIFGFLSLLSALAVQIIIGLNLLFAHKEDFPEVRGGISWGTLWPLIIVIFISLALRGIKKDIELIRSMDRLR